MAVKSFTLIKSAPILGVRHLQVVLLFTCAVLSFQQRINVSVGIVAMTNANISNADFPEYALSEKQKSYMLSSLFWGAMFTILPAGYLADRYGTKILLLFCSLGSALLSICMPSGMAYGGWQLFCLLRFLQGLCQGVLWPCVFSHLAKWCPKEERNRLGGITQSGLDVGTALGFAVSGWLAASRFGWPSMFYVPGAFGIMWSILWLICGANSPQDSSIISLSERKLIEMSSEQSAVQQLNSAPTPWCSILTSLPYFVLVLCKIAQSASFHTLMQQIPTYIHGLYGYSIQLNALLSALPFVFMSVLSYVFLISADVVMRNGAVSLTMVRKFVNTLASWVPAAAFVALCYVSVDNVAASTSCLAVAVASIAAQAIGSSLNHIDLSPNYAGVLVGITNTVMNVVGLLSPLLVGMAVSNEKDRSQWRLVFITIAVLLFFGNLFYLLFGKMEAQPWNDLSSNSGVVDAEKTKHDKTAQENDHSVSVEYP